MTHGTPRAPRRDAPRRRSLAAQFLVLQLGVVALLLLIVGGLGVQQSTAGFAEQRGTQMRTAAEYVANLDVVRDGLSAARTDPAVAADLRRRLAPAVDQARLQAAADDVLLVAPDGTVLAASDPADVGGVADLGDSDATAGRVWTGDVEVDGERTVASHVPVIADDGELLALAVAQQAYPSVWERVTGASGDLALYLGLGAALGITGSVVVARVLRRRTHGLAATDIAELADQREALLHSIREGVVAVGVDGRVTMMNDAARSILRLDDPGGTVGPGVGPGAGPGVDPVGRPVTALGLPPVVADLLAGSDTDVRDATALVGERMVVLNRRAATSRGRGIGSVTTLRDRTELLAVRNRLDANLSLTDTLRAQTHEFDNRLHTISGLVQLGEYDEVHALIGSLTRHRSEVAGRVAARVADPAVAALLVAKDSVAAERGVVLVLDPGSRLPRLGTDVAADLTTVVGNLVDNAVDAAAGSPGAQVEVWLTTVDDVVHVRVRDTGPGVPAEQREAVFVRGFSTKPDADVAGGRGVGLPLVRLICQRRGGTVEVGEARDEGGAEFLVVLPVGVRQGDVS